MHTLSAMAAAVAAVLANQSLTLLSDWLHQRKYARHERHACPSARTPRREAGHRE